MYYRELSVRYYLLTTSHIHISYSLNSILCIISFFDDYNLILYLHQSHIQILHRTFMPSNIGVSIGTLSRSCQTALSIETEFFTICKSIIIIYHVYHCNILVVRHLLKRAHYILFAFQRVVRRAHATYYNIIHIQSCYTLGKLTYIVEITLYTSPPFL